jgi:hypothetical protein
MLAKAGPSNATGLGMVGGGVKPPAEPPAYRRERGGQDYRNNTGRIQEE